MKFISLTTFLLVLATGSLSAQKITVKPDYQLLWKISGNGLKQSSYLFGTMHVQDNRAFNFSDSVLLKISACDAFALEIHPDSLVKEMFNMLMSNDQRTKNQFHKLLKETEYQEFDSLMKMKTGLSLDKVKNPAMARYVLEGNMLKNDKQTFLDAYLFNIARRQGKKIIGLEKVDDQIKLFSEFADVSVKLDLEHYLKNDSSKFVASISQMMAMYESGNILAMRNHLRQTLSKDYYKKLITDRNITMVENMIGTIHLQSVFVAIGAGHLAGEEGVINLLKQRGYSLEVVSPIFTGLARSYKYEAEPDQWEQYSSEKGGYAYSMPKKPIQFKIDSLGVTFDIHFDIGTPLALQTAFIPLSNDFSGYSPKTILEKMEEGMKNRAKTDRGTSFEVDGLLGREFGFYQGKEYFKTRLILRDHIVYMFMAGPTKEAANSPEAMQFMKSFRKLEMRKDEWKSYSSEEGAFTVKMPSEVVSRENKFDQPDAGGLYLIKMIFSTNLSSQETYIVRYNDFPPGYMSMDDSTYYVESVKTIINQMQGRDLEIKKRRINGFEGVEFKFNMAKEAIVKGRIILRGNRFYLLLATGQANNQLSEIDYFLDSFGLLPYRKTPMKGFHLEDLFTIKLPEHFNGVAQNNEDDFDQTESEKKTTYNVVDPNSGMLYIVRINKLSKYTQFKDKEALFKTMTNYYKSYLDSINWQNEISTTRYLGQETSFRSQQVNSTKRVQSFLAGQHHVELIGFLPKDYEQSNSAIEFFSSFALDEGIDSFDVFSDKSTLLLNDLQSTDTLVAADAKNALSDFEFSKTSLQGLYAAIKRDYKDDHEYRPIRSSLLSSLGKTNDSTTLPFILGLYPSFPDSSKLKNDALHVLACLKSGEANQALVDLVQHEAPGSLNAYKVLRPYRDSLEMMNDLIPHLSRIETKFSNPHFLSSLIKTALDSGAIRDDQKATLFNSILESAGKKTSAPALLNKNSDGYYEMLNYLEAVAELLKSVPYSDEVKTIYQNILKSKIPGPMITSAIELIKHNEAVSPSYMITIADDPLYRLELYRQLKEASKLSLFPAKYVTPQKFAESHLLEYMDYDDGAPDHLEFVGTKKILFKNNKQVLYVYRYKYEEDAEWSIAISGPFDRKKKALDEQGDLTFPLYVPYEAKSLHQTLATSLSEYGVKVLK